VLSFFFGSRPGSVWRGVFCVLFVLGGIACVVYGLVKSPSKNDVKHTECPDGPCTTYSTPWAWELGGGVLIVIGLGRGGWAWYVGRDDTERPARSGAQPPE